MKRKTIILVMVATVLMSGCRYIKPKSVYILRESEQYYLIPAGTPFTAIVRKGEPPVEVIRNSDTWAVDAGYLMKLQREANARVLEPPE